MTFDHSVASFVFRYFLLCVCYVLWNMITTKKARIGKTCFLRGLAVVCVCVFFFHCLIGVQQWRSGQCSAELFWII